MNLNIISFLIFSFFSSALAAAELGNLSVTQVQTMRQNTDTLVIDVRTPKEWQSTGIIPNSHKLVFFDSNGKYDAKKWLSQMQQLRSSPDQPVILVCQSGNRSGRVGNFLTKQLGMKNIYHLSTGIQSWIKAGIPVTPDCNKPTCQ